jgi:hypothetical protein
MVVKVIIKSHHKYDSAGYYYVSLKVSNTTGCNSVSSKVVNVLGGDKIKAMFGYKVIR